MWPARLVFCAKISMSVTLNRQSSNDPVLDPVPGSLYSEKTILSTLSPSRQTQNFGILRRGQNLRTPATSHARPVPGRDSFSPTVSRLMTGKKGGTSSQSTEVSPDVRRISTNKYQVDSFTSVNTRYQIMSLGDGEWWCNCPHWRFTLAKRQQKSQRICKHILLVLSSSTAIPGSTSEENAAESTSSSHAVLPCAGTFSNIQHRQSVTSPSKKRHTRFTYWPSSSKIMNFFIYHTTTPLTNLLSLCIYCSANCWVILRANWLFVNYLCATGRSMCVHACACVCLSTV